jgi:type I restriction enzyme, S subunit
LKASDYVEQGTPVINVRNIGFGTIKPDKLEYLAPATVERLSSHLLRAADIVFGRKGAVERHVLIRTEQNGWFQGSDCLRLRFNSPRIDSRFVSYCLLTDDHKQWMINQCSHGATMASLNQEIIWRIPLRVPDITTQRKIASILSAYDDLIENNARRIAILEAMAQAIYREWFVEFRFPCHEGVKLVNSPLGRIPDGWEVVRLESLKSNQPHAITGGPFGSKLGTKDYVTCGVPVIRGTNLSETGHFSSDDFVFVSETKADELSANLARPGDIVVTQRGTLGQVGMIPHGVGFDRFVISQSQMKVTLSDTKAAREYILYFLKSPAANTRIKSLAVSSGVPHINLGTLRDFEVLLPPLAIQQRFAEFASSTERSIELDLSRIRNLRKTRDLLLPRLISGRLDVEDLDIDTGQTVVA